MKKYPKIGIRPTIDGRQGGVRESLEEKTMNLAKAVAELISSNLKNGDGSPVECVIADSTIGRVAESAACAEKFEREGVGSTITVTSCWCYGAETMDMNPHYPKAVWGFNGTERPGAGTSEEAEAIARVFSECRSISIDYGVMEKANNVYVRRGEFGWSDVGTWGSLYQHARKDRYANAKPEKGCYTDENTRSCIVSLPEGKVAVINGLKEYIVVDTEDVLLICPRSEEQNIKKFIDEVKYNEGDKHI